MDVDLFTLLIFLVVLLVSLWFLTRRRNLPPGPWSNHIFGHIMECQRSTDYYRTLMEYRRHYGDIFRLRFGTHPVIVLNNHKLIRKALVEQANEFSERPDWLTATNHFVENKGIIVNRYNWQAMRRFAMSSMRDFGVGKSTTEEKCQEEIEVLTDEFAKHEGKTFDCRTIITNAVSNIICSVVFGKRFDYDDERFQNLITLINNHLKLNAIYSLSNVTTFVLHLALLLDKGIARETKHRGEKMREFVKEMIAQHRDSFDPENIRDFTDLYLLSEQEDSELHGKVSEANAFQIIMDMFIAGTETTSTTLQWLMIYMMYNTVVQDKCRQEIHQVLGPERIPSMSDRGKLPYTEATLLEVQRIACIAPFALPHTTKRDVILEGYTIPKGAFIIPNIYSCLHDHDVWGDPDNFRPERWMGEDGTLIHEPSFIPFSVGKRACAGESLAKMEIFLFGVALLQRFKFRMADKRPSLLPHQGLTNVPRDFDMIVDVCA